MAKGNMYEFVNKTHNVLGGECLHGCKYCYVNSMKQRFPKLKEKYSGEYKIIEKELLKKFKANETVFACDCNDLFQKDVPTEHIIEILGYYSKFKNTIFIFQTKNTERANKYIPLFPVRSILIVTVESNRDYNEIYEGIVLNTNDRVHFIEKSRCKGIETQITIEPILDFDLIEFVELLKKSNVNQINIGANTSKIKLPEPNKDKILSLINECKKFAKVHLKSNLNRLIS